MPLPSCTKPAPIALANDLAERALTIAAMLPVTMQPVFAAWLFRHSGRAVLKPNKYTLSAWFSKMQPEKAEQEYGFILARVGWLELITESTQIDLRQKDIPVKFNFRSAIP